MFNKLSIYIINWYSKNNSKKINLKKLFYIIIIISTYSFSLIFPKTTYAQTLYTETFTGSNGTELHNLNTNWIPRDNTFINGYIEDNQLTNIGDNAAYYYAALPALSDICVSSDFHSTWEEFDTFIELYTRRDASRTHQNTGVIRNHQYTLNWLDDFNWTNGTWGNLDTNWHNAKLCTIGGVSTLYLDNKQVAQYNGSQASNGFVGFEIGRGMYIDNFVISTPDHSSSLPVPLLKQTDSQWGKQTYDSANIWNPSDPTIGSWGCALTSAAMVFQYYGINKLPDGTPLDPDTLNTWLRNQPDGYVGNGLLNWLALSRLSKLAASKNNISTFDALEYQRVGGNNTHELSSDLNNSIPAILEEPGHFIVGTGISGSTFTINDPYYNRTNLENGYNNSFLSLGKYTPSHTDLSYIMAVSDKDVNIKLSDDNNNPLGSEFIQQPIVNPSNPAQSSGQPQNFFYLQKPTTGIYKLSATSTASTMYQLFLYLYDQNGNVLPVQQTTFLNKNTPTTFTINFDSTNVATASVVKSVTFQSVKADIKQLQKMNLINQTLAASLLTIVVNSQTNTKKNPFTATQYLTAGEMLLNQSKNNTVVIKPEAYQIITADFIGLQALINI